MKRTSIEWTDFSSNPLQYRDQKGNVVWGCVKKSSGCANCYSEAIALRFERGGPFTRAAMEGVTPFLDEKELKHILTAKTVGGKPVSGSRCFLGDMTDVFGEWVPDGLLDRLFAAMALRPDVTFQILTKRADRMARYYADGHRNGRGTHTSVFVARQMCYLANQYGIDPVKLDEVIGLGGKWPANIWLGTSVENQPAADERIPHLLATPAAVRFLSCEPLLGPIDFRKVPEFNRVGTDLSGWWVIVGGESGPGARPMQLEWASAIVRQCKAASVPVFVKQLGAVPLTNLGVDDGHSAYWPVADKKGGDISEFPPDLRVREFPASH